MLVVIAIIIGFKVSGKRSADLEIIIVTERKMTIVEVKDIITDSLKKSDQKVKVSVRESSDEVVKLENTFVGTISTTLNEDEIIKTLSIYKGFKYVQPNYEFKIED